VAVTVLADLHFKPEAAEEALKGLIDLLPDTRTFEGCRSVHVVRDQGDPSHVVLVEEWDSADDQRAYLAWRAETGALAGFAEVVTQPPVFTAFDQLQSF
jgi:quinol monooxygenase YgiN